MIVRSFVSASHTADLAPASFAAFSILDLHIPQFPDTLKVSVFAWAVAPVGTPRVANASDTAARENIFTVFMIIILRLKK